MKIKYWCDSGANAFSCKEGETTVEELGLTLEEWNRMSEGAKENLMYEVACDRLDWGYNVED